jgi:hypothetical protein
VDTIFNAEGCFYRALDDEPVFVLLARDPCFAEAVRWWVTLRQALIGRGEKPLEDHSVLADAMATAAAGHVWRADATDPVKYLEEPRWHREKAPQRELIETDRLARLETRLLKNANRFLQYAQNHFDKGTAESDAKGEVNWQEYLAICTDLNINPAEKPVGKGQPRSATKKHEDIDWLAWRHDAMPIGNDFLMGPLDGGMWFVQRQHANEPVWSDLYMLQKSLQADMLRGVYSDWKSGIWNKAELIKSLVPDHKALMAKIAVGLRQVTANMIGQSEARMEDTSVEAKGFLSEAMDQYADRINGYALELEHGLHAGAPVEERKVGKSPALAAPYGQPPKAESDTLDVTDTPDMPPHRFTMFTKARGWAYGRGLEINPSHIPDMLDRMDADGWHLQCVFGGVVPDKVGMLFRRGETVWTRPLPPSVVEMMAAPTEGVEEDCTGYGRGQQP